MTARADGAARAGRPGSRPPRSSRRRDSPSPPCRVVTDRRSDASGPTVFDRSAEGERGVVTARSSARRHAAPPAARGSDCTAPPRSASDGRAPVVDVVASSSSRGSAIDDVGGLISVRSSRRCRSTSLMYAVVASGSETDRSSCWDMNQRCSSSSWNTSAGSSRPRRSRGMARTTGSNTRETHSCATISSSSSSRPLRARYASRSLSSRRAWFSSASRPVRRSSRRWWWPASTTFGWIRTWEPASAVRIDSSSMSKPRAFSRSTRSLMRHRSAASNCSVPVSSVHRVRYCATIRFDTSTGSAFSSRRPPASRSRSSPAMFTRATSRSFSRCPFDSPPG